MKSADDRLLVQENPDLDDPQLRAAIATLPSPSPSRDLVAEAMANRRAGESRKGRKFPVRWPRLLKVAAAAAILVAAAALLHRLMLTTDDEPAPVAQVKPLEPEEAAPITPILLTTRRHLVGTKRRFGVTSTSSADSEVTSLDVRLRQARRRLRAIKRRNPDLPTDETINNNGAMRQEGVRDEACHVDSHLLAARSGERTGRPRGRA